MAREFNGSSQYITPAAELDISGTAITISAWVYIDTLTADKMIVCKGDASAYNYNYFLSITNLGWLPDSGHVVFGYINGSTQHAAEGATLLSVNTWYHLLGVYNGATQKIFINAVEDASMAETGSMTQNNYAMKIGASPNGAGNALYHDGRIAEVGIWNAALNADEIKALKNGISPAFIRGESLLAYYPLIGTESPEPDVKGGNNGTVTGATAVEHVAITYPQALINEWAKISAAGGVSVSPTPSAAAAGTVAPTTVLGSLSLTPAVDSAAAASVAPTVVLGSISIAPTPASAASASVAPTTVLGSLTIAPSARSAAAASVAPTIVLGSTVAAPTPASAASASVAPTTVLGSLTIAPSARSAAAASIAPTTVLGSISIAPTPVSAASASVAPTTVLGSISIAPTPVSAASASVAPTTVLGSLTISPAAGSAVAASVNPTVSAGGNLTITPAAVNAAASSVAPTVVLGSVTVAPTARTAAAASVAPTVVLGSTSVTPTVSTAAAASVAPTVVLGGLSVTPTADAAAAASIAPTVVLGSTSVMPTASTAAAVSVAPTTVLSSLSLTPTVDTATAASVAPTVVLGSLAIAPTARAASAVTINPTVDAGGDLTLTPALANAAAVSVAPTTIFGSLSIAPTPAVAAAASTAPTTVLGSIAITLGFAAIVAASVAPTVVLSNPSITPTPRTAAAGTVAPTVMLSGLSISPSPISATALTIAPTVVGGGTIVTPDTVPCYPSDSTPPPRPAPGTLYARIDTIDVPVIKASVTWKLDAIAEFSVSVPARSISRQQAYFADIALWEGGVKVISGIVIDTPQIELNYQGVSQLTLRCIDEVGRLTTTRAIITKHVQDEWLPQAVNNILRVANWELNDYTTLANMGARVTVDLRNKDTLFAQVVEVLKSVPKTLFRYGGINEINGKRRLDIGFFGTRLNHLVQGVNLISLKLQHNTAKLVRVLEAYSDALPDRRITLADALNYPTIHSEPDFANYPITYDSRGNYVMTNVKLTRGCDMAKSFSMHRTSNEGVPSNAEIAAAGFSVWQRGVRFLQQSDDYISATATGLFEEIPKVGDRMYVKGSASETVWDAGTLNYRDVPTFDLAEEMRITQVTYNFEHAVSQGYVAHRPIDLYQCTVELTTSPYPEEFDEAATIVEAVQTFKQYDKPNSVPHAGALTYVNVSQTAFATDTPDIACGSIGKQFTFPVPTPPGGAATVTANVISMSNATANYSIVQAAAYPSTPFIICATVAGGWGADNLTVTVQFMFS